MCSQENDLTKTLTETTLPFALCFLEGRVSLRVAMKAHAYSRSRLRTRREKVGCVENRAAFIQDAILRSPRPNDHRLISRNIKPLAVITEEKESSRG